MWIASCIIVNFNTVTCQTTYLTSLSSCPFLGTIGSVSDGSFLSMAAPRRQALKYFF